MFPFFHINRRQETIKCVLFTLIKHKKLRVERRLRGILSMPVGTCAPHKEAWKFIHGKCLFTSLRMCFSFTIHLLLVSLLLYIRFPYQLCECIREERKRASLRRENFCVLLFYSFRYYTALSVCIGTSKLSVVELVNNRSSSTFFHWHFYLKLKKKIFIFKSSLIVTRTVNYLYNKCWIYT